MLDFEDIQASAIFTTISTPLLPLIIRKLLTAVSFAKIESEHCNELALLNKEIRALFYQSKNTIHKHEIPELICNSYKTKPTNEKFLAISEIIFQILNDLNKWSNLCLSDDIQKHSLSYSYVFADDYLEKFITNLTTCREYAIILSGEWDSIKDLSNEEKGMYFINKSFEKLLESPLSDIIHHYD